MKVIKAIALGLIWTYICFGVLTCCSKDNTKIYNVDDRLEPLLYEFVQHASDYDIDVSDMFDHDIEMTISNDLPNASKFAAAAAYKKNINGIEIIFRESAWYDSTDEARKLIVYHELGHDYFNLDHDEDNYVMKQSANPWVIKIYEDIWAKFFEHAKQRN